jgi:glycosyltransferase involved in cell wall biosynthesis
MSSERSIRRAGKVLMTADASGSVFTHAVELSHGLAERGIKVTLAIMGDEPRSQQLADAAAVPGLELRYAPFKLEWMEGAEDDFAHAARWLTCLEDAVAPDIVHLSSFAFGAAPFKAPKLVVGHSCELSRWEAVHNEPAPPLWDRYREVVKRGIEHASYLVAPTRAMLSVLERLYGKHPHSRHIWNGCTPERFRSGEKDMLIFSAGRLWDRGKNIGTLARAALSIPWPIYVAGDDVAPDGKRVWLEDLNVLGRLSSRMMARWLSQAAIYVHPARYEPFGLTVLEAAFSRCALVLGDIPSLREIWDDAAIFVAPHDVKAIASALNGLIEDPFRRERMGEQAAVRARDLTSSSMAEAYIGVYREMTERP